MRLRNKTIEDLGILPLGEANLTITLLNTRSLKKHIIDIARDEEYVPVALYVLQKHIFYQIKT